MRRHLFGKPLHKGLVIFHASNAPCCFHGNGAKSFFPGKLQKLIHLWIDTIRIHELGMFIDPVFHHSSQNLCRALSTRDPRVPSITVLRKTEVFHQTLFFQPLKSTHKSSLIFKLINIMVAVMELHIIKIT